MKSLKKIKTQFGWFIINCSQLVPLYSKNEKKKHGADYSYSLCGIFNSDVSQMSDKKQKYKRATRKEVNMKSAEVLS